MRAGNPVRARHILLMKMANASPSAPPERSGSAARAGRTDHLLGRLVLHAPPRPGREHDALEVGQIEHASRAVPVFRELERPHDLGRLSDPGPTEEMAAGRPREAVEHLGAAADLQQRIADVIGLARTSAALAETP